ncbi:MAG: TIGR03279 family radical SAM protein [Cyanobacteria bacterium P01_F01_bin.150]
MSESTSQPALVTQVIDNSIAAELGFEPGDRLVSINGVVPRDLIDYQFLCADEYLELEVLDSTGQSHHVELEKDYDDDLGLEFETALFDGLIQCNNRCPFCFIDQQPPGKRKTLYLKDDDYRLSFLYGSYLTLTNLPEQEWERIAQMRLSPLYVSVHSTEPELRQRLLKNHRAGQIMDQLAWFQSHRLQIHAQVVVCPTINDGEHLTQTISDLARFGVEEVIDGEDEWGALSTVSSVAVVPVGLTRFRPDHDALTPVTKEKAREVIAQVQAIQSDFCDRFGTSFVWLADEWFLIGQVDLPPASHYESYPQIGNGVGSIHHFLREFDEATQNLPARISPSRTLTWVVGNAVEYAFQSVLQRFNNVNGLTLSMAALSSDYWGRDITVTGLLTGHDLLYFLKNTDLGDGIVLPSLMLKQGDVCFLDDLTVDQVSQKLGVPIYVVDGVEELVETCCGDRILQMV